MVAAGLVIMLLGFLLSLFSLTLASGNGGRLILVLLGLAVSLFGLIGVLNRAYLNNAIWKK